MNKVDKLIIGILQSAFDPYKMRVRDTYMSSTVFSWPSPTFMKTSSIVVTDTPKLLTPYSLLLAGMGKTKNRVTRVHTLFQALNSRTFTEELLALNLMISSGNFFRIKDTYLK